MAEMQFTTNDPSQLSQEEITKKNARMEEIRIGKRKRDENIITIPIQLDELTHMQRLPIPRYSCTTNADTQSSSVNSEVRPEISDDIGIHLTNFNKVILIKIYYYNVKKITLCFYE